MENKHKIRTRLDGSVTWFNALDLFHVLGKTWRGKPDLYKKGVESCDIKEIKVDTEKGVKASVFIRDKAFYRLLVAESDYNSEVSNIAGKLLFNQKRFVSKLIAEK